MGASSTKSPPSTHYGDSNPDAWEEQIRINRMLIGTTSTNASTYSYSSGQSTNANSANVRPSVYSFNAPSSSSTVTTIRQYNAPTIDQLEEADIARAIRLSLTENQQTNRLSNFPSSSSSSSTLTQYPRNNTSTYVNRPITLRKTSVLTSASIPASTSASAFALTSASASESTSASTPKGEMAFDCSICMEYNEKDEIVATNCGHLFHRACVSPWIRQEETCPTCRARGSIASLRKIFISSTSSGSALKTNTTDSGNNNTSNVNTNNNRNKNKNKNSNSSGNRVNNNNSGNQHRNCNITHNVTSPRTVTSSTMYGRTIWLSSQDKQMTKQSLAAFILQRFNITAQQISIKSLKKASAAQPQQPYVSFKISVDRESTFNTLAIVTNWPREFRVREFIERN